MNITPITEISHAHITDPNSLSIIMAVYL